MQTLACQLSSILMQLLFPFDWDTRVEKTLMQTLACQLSSTLMQLLFSFDHWTRELTKTLVQTHACQLSCNSCFRLTGTRKLRKLSCKLSLVNSHQLSCSSCSRLTETRELRKLSLVNSHRLTGATEMLTYHGMITNKVVKYSESRIKFSFFTRSPRFRVSKGPLDLNII